jgi:hypothetical protein
MIFVGADSASRWTYAITVTAQRKASSVRRIGEL